MFNNKLRITCPARLHLCLFSMNTKMLRVNGGVGFGINAPNIVVVVKECTEFEVSDSRVKGLNQVSKANLIKTMQQAMVTHGLRKKISVNISGLANIHNGFGTGTSIYLACMEALMLINIQPIRETELIQYSGRGGTSGIGIRSCRCRFVDPGSCR